MNGYVHIPFCDSICFYCDFCRIVSNDKTLYLNALEREIQSLSFSKFDTLYFGGGTPSLLNEQQLMQISKYFSFNDHYEWTIECNPDSIDERKCKSFKKMGINRISLGVQTFNDTLLKSIGRSHSASDVMRCIKLLKENGLDNISIDLMYGLPNQTMEDVVYDLEQFIKLEIPHLSIYSLQIEENSVFGKKGIMPIDDELEADMFECICAFLKEKGYVHYEISSFCKDGYYSKHNLCYWNDSDFIGIGCGASGKENNCRYDHTKNIKEYIQNPTLRYWIENDMEDKKFEAIMMSLRTIFGLDINAFNKRYHCDFLEEYQPILIKYEKYFHLSGNRISVNEKGMEILNTILVDFLKD